MNKIWIQVKMSCLADLVYGSGIYAERYIDRPYIVKYAPTISEMFRRKFIECNENIKDEHVEGLLFGLTRNKFDEINTYTQYCDAVSSLTNRDLFSLDSDAIIIEAKLEDDIIHPEADYHKFTDIVSVVDHHGDITSIAELDNMMLGLFIPDNTVRISGIPEIKFKNICGIHPPCGWSMVFENGTIGSKFQIDTENLGYIEECRQKIVGRKMHKSIE